MANKVIQLRDKENNNLYVQEPVKILYTLFTDVPSNYTFESMRARIVGKMCYLTGWLSRTDKTAFPAARYTFQLVSDLLPAEPVAFVCYASNTYNYYANRHCSITINTSGRFNVDIFESADIKFINFSVVYPIA